VHTCMVKPRSTFHQALVEKLDRPLAWIPFIWSGANSFHARNAAAEELATRLAQHFTLAPNAEHVVVCHSHGGSVAVNAARLLDLRGENHISKIISMASPFVRHNIANAAIWRSWHDILLCDTVGSRY
jgi:surfactin synthase thioesterase subunit